MDVGHPGTLPEWLLAAAMGILSWAALRLVRKVDNLDKLSVSNFLLLDDKVDEVDKRVIRVEAKMDNGLTHSVEEIRDSLNSFHARLTEHIEGEERRILAFQRATQRHPGRTRTTDGGT